MKAIQKIVAVILLLTILLPSLHLNIITSFESFGATVDGCINGSEVCDYGEDGSYLKLDDTGRLWLHTEEGYSLIADLSAELIAVYGNTLYYSSCERFYSYDLESGDAEHIFSADAPIRSFSMSESRVYYIADGTVFYFENGHSQRLSLSLKNPSALPQGTDLESPEKLRLESQNKLYIYYKNENYIDESLCEIGLEVENNTEYISCLYRVDKKEFSYVDPLLISETEITESLVNAGSSYTINGVSLPLSQYPVNSFFSKNGKSCTCHNKGICVAALSSRGCNCMRYYPSESKCEIDLLGSQCMGFARFCQWILYGAIDYNNSNFYNAFGKNLESGEWSASVLKSYIYKAGAGGHLRTGSGHSLFVINVDSTGFITYEANKSVWGSMCQVYTRTWTWESFYKRYGAYDLVQYKIPHEVNVGGGSSGGVEENPYPVGTYITTAESGLRLRDTYGTGSTALALLPYGTILTVTETKDISGSGNYWGKTSYNGITGWISLEYAAHQTAEIVGISIETLPDKVNYTEGDKFSDAGLVVQALMSNGTSTQISGYTCSGYNMNVPGTQTVTVTYGSHSTKFTIKIDQKKVYPTNIVLSENKIVLLKGDTLELDYTIYPLDATELDVTWTCNNNDEAYISFQNGEITANGECTAKITVTTSNGLSASCDVQIVTLPKGTSWSSPMYQLPFGITTLDYQIQYGKVSGGNLDNVSWTYVPYGDEVDPKDGYVYRFRRYTLDLLVNGQSMPDYPQVTTVGTPLNLAKGDFLLLGSDSAGLFAGWYVHNSENGSWDACSSKYTVVGDTTMLASFIPLTPVVSDPSDPSATAESLSPFTVMGTEVYIGDNNYGLRFKTRLSKQLISAIEEINPKNSPLTPKSSSSKGVGYGSVTVIASKISGNLIKGSTSASYLKDGSAVIVPAVNTHNDYTNYIIYTSLVLDYTSEYHKTNIAVRPYVTYYTCNGVSVTFYATMKGNYTKGGAYYTNLYARAEDLYKKTEDNNTKVWLKDNILTDK